MIKLTLKRRKDRDGPFDRRKILDRPSTRPNKEGRFFCCIVCTRGIVFSVTGAADVASTVPDAIIVMTFLNVASGNNFTSFYDVIVHVL